MQNELGMDVPHAVVKRAKDKECIQGVKYVYKDGVYGDKFPAASIGGKKATRFGSIDRADANKVSLGSGWVAFMSPSYADVTVTNSGSKPESKKNTFSNVKSDGNDKSTTRNINSAPNFLLSIKRGYDFFRGFIRLKVSVTNNTSLVLTDVELDFHYDEKNLHLGRSEPDYDLKKERFHLGNIHANMSKSIAVYFEPMMCSKGTVIDCIVTYKDATGHLQTAKMEPERIEVTCPILKSDHGINIARLCQLIETLPCKDSRIYGIRSDYDALGLKNSLLSTMQNYDLRHLRTLRTNDDGQYEMWFYSRTKVKTNDIVLRLSISSKERTVELFAATADAQSLTGLLADMGREVYKAIEKEIKGKELVYQVFNVNITDSIIQRSNLLSFCDMHDNCEGDVVVDNSVVHRSKIASIDR
ncbi:hypothetical protein [Methanolobus psychrotolerans]|uniref:hypothetical protein n=1 Tax=Methanolobus psychrotolerans TaxID=1874706 RepID=UPI000B9159C3|nr:hypothetical protein [Methanolobus psychrotolerans]